MSPSRRFGRGAQPDADGSASAALERLSFNKTRGDLDAHHSRIEIDLAHKRCHERNESAAFQLENVLRWVMTNRNDAAENTVILQKAAADQILIEVFAFGKLRFTAFAP